MPKILVIDDAPADIKMMTSILESAHHAVVPCLNGDGAEEKVASEKPALVLLDIVMPERNGYQILRNLKRDAATKHVPVVLVSSKGEESDIAWGKRQGADDYIVKPYTPDTVLNTIRRFLAS